jgi:hypothetical protein
VIVDIPVILLRTPFLRGRRHFTEIFGNGGLELGPNDLIGMNTLASDEVPVLDAGASDMCWTGIRTGKRVRTRVELFLRFRHGKVGKRRTVSWKVKYVAGGVFDRIVEGG